MVFASVALEMGIDLREVDIVIHYGGMQKIDDYFQESGRGGRSGWSARSIVFGKPVDCLKRKELLNTWDQEVAAVRLYLENTTSCHWKCLLQYFDLLCSSSVTDCSKCCDGCASRDERHS